MHRTLPVLAAMASAASATLNVRNHCAVPVHIYRSTDGSCNLGPNEICQGSAGAAPWAVVPGAVAHFARFGWDVGTSIKIAKDDPTLASGILQFEYTWRSDDGIYWNLSDLDGRGAGLVGTPFADDSVVVTPTGAGVGEGTCAEIRCEAGAVCADSYQHPEDHNTRWCPLAIGEMWLDLCLPDQEFHESVQQAGGGSSSPRCARRKRRAEASWT